MEDNGYKTQEETSIELTAVEEVVEDMIEGPLESIEQIETQIKEETQLEETQEAPEVPEQLAAESEESSEESAEESSEESSEEVPTLDNDNTDAISSISELAIDGETEEGVEFALELDCFDDEDQEDRLWQARTGLNEDTLCGAIETIVFMGDKPLPLNKIKALIDEDMPLRVLHTAITRLQTEYESKHHGIRLVEVAEGYQFRTKATFSKYVQDLFKVNSLVLSPTALEVLAILAYKQPVAKTEVDKIRGVDSGHIVRGLMDKRLVKVVGRSEEMGRPVLYGTTPEFLEVFNLPDLSQLPPEHQLEEIIENGIGKVSDIRTLINSKDREMFSFDEMEELESLHSSIKAISADTSFTKSLKVQEKRRTTEEGEKVKTAFDLLEEFVTNDLMVALNNEAVESNIFTAVTQPTVINDLTAGPFNEPEVLEESEDDFQMIDLDTGLPIEDEPVILGEDILQMNNGEEVQALSEALDAAFSKLTGESLSETAEALPLESGDEMMNTKEGELEELTEKIVDQARGLDLDLSFLGQDIENAIEKIPEPEESVD